MKTISILLFLLLASIAVFPGCSSNPNTQRGAAGGAVAGAVIGGIIGHQSGEAGAGAALGAAAGGLAGGAYGKSKDNAVNTNQGRDSHGYSSADYLALLTPDESRTLERRTQGNTSVVDPSDYLTSEEKANLRARAKRQNTIGN